MSGRTRVAFATAAQWVARLADAHHTGRLEDELIKLGRIPLLIIDEVGYIPFEAEAANLFFQLVSSRYERASLIVTSNKPFGRWGEVFGDDVVADNAASPTRIIRDSMSANATNNSRPRSSSSSYTDQWPDDPPPKHLLGQRCKASLVTGHNRPDLVV